LSWPQGFWSANCLTQIYLLCDGLCKFIQHVGNSLTVPMSHRTLYGEERIVSQLRGTLPENKFMAHIFESTVMTTVFWDIEGNWLVDVLKEDATINSERCVQTVKKLKRRIRRVRPNRKINQVVLHYNARP
jgi:hypothetical protein